MVHLNLNINFNNYIYFLRKHWKLLFISIIALAIIGFLIWVVCSYYFLKWLKRNIDDDYFYFNQYTKASKKILDRYGDCKIKHIYLCRKSVTDFHLFLINLITFNRYKDILTGNGDKKNNVLFPHHTSIIVELKLKNKMYKKILIEKNNYIRLAGNFKITDKEEMIKIKCTSKKYTIRQILNKTQERLGNDKFFNWHISKNNCQEFTKQFLTSIDEYNDKNKLFIFQQELFDRLKLSDFSYHLINSAVNVYNMIEQLALKLFFN